MSQLSQSSTIPYGLSQDSTFLEEIREVDQLYFHETSDINTVVNETSESDIYVAIEYNPQYVHSDSESETNTEINDDSDDESSSQAGIINDHNDIQFDPTDEDVLEKETAEHFFRKTCGCSKLYGQPCSSVIEQDTIVSLREFSASLERHELDLVVKSSLYSHRQNGTKTNSGKHMSKDRERPSQRFFLKGQEVCKIVFCFAYGIGNAKYLNITQSLDSNGLISRTHGNTKRSPHNSLLFSDREHIKKFIERYANENAVPLPGRLPNQRESKVLLLPSDKTKSDIYEVYVLLAQSMNLRQICLKTFSRIWNELCPNIVLSKPSTDLCHKCQMYSYQVAHSGSVPDEEKESILEAYKNHVRQAQMQRDQYRQQCAESKLICNTLPLVEDADPCTLRDVAVHYSWDFAQQVHIPHYCQQVGPIFFKTPLKCEVFGMCCEGSEKQVFYLTKEGQAPGKGGNTVVSYVHHYLQYYGYGEDTAKFHFDNCSGQNKNNTVLWYAMWRVLTGLHCAVEYSLMIAGHTKFSPDWHFGLWKSRWRHVDAETMADVACSVQQSSRNGHNVPHIVDDNNRSVPFYDWKNFFKRFFKPLKKISQYHSYRVHVGQPGIVICKRYVDSPEEQHSLLRKGAQLPCIGAMPEEIGGEGLNEDRQWYLFDNIRQFCRSDRAKDQICPLPKCDKLKTGHKKRKC